MGLRSLSNRLLGACVVLLATCAPAVWSAEEKYLPPEQAFPLAVRLLDAQRIELRFDVAPGYYLYRDKITVTAQPSSVALGETTVPRGTVKYDATFEKDVESLRERVPVVVSVPSSTLQPGAFQLQVGSQGCADKGLCYPPMQRTVQVEAGPAGLLAVNLPNAVPAATASSGGGLLAALTGGGVRSASEMPSATGTGAGTSTGASGAAGDEAFGRVLASRNLLSVGGVFLLAGLLLSFTPCVLPMVPILSSIIVGQSERVSRARGFSLALSYSLGMAIVYTAFGVAAALLGEGLGAALQNPWVLGAFALLLAALSLSMFGVYELQMPQALQQRFAAASNRFKGGQFIGVFVMGGLSAVIVGPCVAAPLAGALVYISQTRDTVLGGAALFSMAVGMSVPLLLVGLSAGTLLPRTGAWMRHVKHFFGLLLLGVALWMVTPVLPVWVVMVAAAVLLLAGGVYLGAFEPLQGHGHGHPGRTLTKGVGIGLSLLAAMQLVGVASGGRSLLQPLAHLAAGPTGSAGAAGQAELRFAPIATLAALDEAVRTSTKPVMVDFYADWCVSCKEFETFTLTDPAVRAKLAGMNLLRVDVTANSEADKELLRRHQLFGPPAMLFFPPAGGEIPGSRVIGFQSAPRFLEHLARIEPLTRTQ
ncbi:protein-disulfide reductase DsbD [Rhizobacter sp. LjRoot28]|uniref:protein-disulfide reductase DsbD n=1 Tax=Rhizobacter sp. LjRoot28 TaxID=3342309 RepID=UPI003ECD9E3F